MNKANLIRAINEPDNLEVRGGMMLASLYAGLAFSNSILGAVHAMAHSLGGFLDLPHGLCNAILLDYVIEFNFEAAPERYVEIGRAMGADIPDQAGIDEKKDLVIGAVRDLKRGAGVTQCLAELGVTPAMISELAAKAVNDPCMVTNPKHATAEDLGKVYEKACRKR